MYTCGVQEHEDWNRKLELANARIKKLQAENEYVCSCIAPALPSLRHTIIVDNVLTPCNSLLLDAISIAIPAPPSLLHLIHPSSTSITPVPTPPHVQQHSTGQAPPHHTNGHTYSHSNGRYREREPERLEVSLLLDAPWFQNRYFLQTIQPCADRWCCTAQRSNASWS